MGCSGACLLLLDGIHMNRTMDAESRKVSAIKYSALALCLFLFVVYGLVVG